MNNNKNITLRIKGGIGNQLFIFSFLIYLQKKYKLNIYIDFKSGYQSLLGGNKFKQKFLLNKLNYFFLYQKDKYCFLGFFGKVKRFLVKNIIFFSNFFNIDYLDENENTDIVYLIKKSNKKNIYIDGYFQDIKYVNYSNFYINKSLTDLSLSTQSIFSKKKFFNLENTLCILFTNYIHQDLKEKNIYIQRLKNILLYNKKFINFFIFSSQEPFFLKKLLPKKKYKFFKPNNKSDSLNNLLLISNFKYYITDNSTYHWWGSWLSRNKKKIIFIPEDFNSKINYPNCKLS